MSTEDLSLYAQTWEQGFVRIEMRGALNAKTYGLLEREFTRWFGKQCFSFALGMEGLREMTIAGAGILTALMRNAQEQGGRVILVSPGAGVKKSFQSLGILPLLPIVSSFQELTG